MVVVVVIMVMTQLSWWWLWWIWHGYDTVIMAMVMITMMAMTQLVVARRCIKTRLYDQPWCIKLSILSSITPNHDACDGLLRWMDGCKLLCVIAIHLPNGLPCGSIAGWINISRWFSYWEGPSSIVTLDCQREFHTNTIWTWLQTTTYR